MGPTGESRPSPPFRFSHAAFRYRQQQERDYARKSNADITTKMRRESFAQKLRRILRPVVREFNYRHDSLLINSLAAFNFRRPLEFPGELLSRYREFAQ
jgi:hypothetical protein